MKAKALLLLLALFFFECGQDDENEKTTEPFEEVPDGIVASKPCSTLYQGIMEMFMEHKRNHEKYTDLFAGGAEKRIVLTKDSEVYVSFISEGAGWANTFGYYTYNENNPPGSPSDIEKIVVFPHISQDVLEQGDMLQLGDGPFPAGTVVGFFLIMRGWQNGVVDYRKGTHYTDMNLNHNGYQQHILFKEGECSDIVLAFEDRTLDFEDCDFDYNDVILTVADNKEQLETTSFKLANLVNLQSPN
jgi:hypothetical protein